MQWFSKTIIAMATLGLLVAGFPATFASQNPNADQAVVIQSSKNSAKHLLIKKAERKSGGLQNVWLVYDQVNRRVVVLVKQDKTTASYFTQINQLFSNGTEIDLPLSAGPAALAGETLRVRIDGSHDGTKFSTNELQVVFSDQTMSWLILPQDGPDNDALLRACILGCTTASPGKYETCLRICLDAYGTKK
jgi:hypothetical protein